MLRRVVLLAVPALFACEPEVLQPLGGDDGLLGGFDDGDRNVDPANVVGGDGEVGCGFVEQGFAFPDDELACNGLQMVRFDDRYGLFVGVVTCDEANTEVRLYLSERLEGPFFPATDTAGNGQDQCELVHPGFTIGNEDSIGSGNCPQCSTSRNLPLEGVSVFNRANFGEDFEFVARTGEWSFQTSRLGCGIDVTTCGATAVPGDIWLPEDGAIPPSSDVPCSAGGVALMSFPISAEDMRNGASDDSGPGFCIGDIDFGADFSGMTAQCDEVHCATVLNGAGEAAPRLCTAFAVCDRETGLAHTTGYTW